MSFEDRFYTAVTEYLNAHTDVSADRVTGIDQETYSDGYCETCWYEYIVLEIFYVEADTGAHKIYVYRGNMADLMRELS